MGRILLAVLAVSLAVPSADAAAEGFLSRAIQREAVRTGGATAGHEAERNSDDQVSWARVRRLQPGTEISLTLQGADRQEHLFLDAGESELRTIYIQFPGLLATTREVLAHLAAHAAAYLTAPESGRVYQEGSVRVAQGIVAVNGVEVATLANLVTTSPRRAVLELRAEARPTPTHSAGTKGTLIGLGVGLGVAALVNAGSSGADRGYVLIHTAPVLGAVGAGAGFLIGSLHRHGPGGEAVVYRSMGP